MLGVWESGTELATINIKRERTGSRDCKLTKCAGMDGHARHVDMLDTLLRAIASSLFVACLRPAHGLLGTARGTAEA